MFVRQLTCSNKGDLLITVAVGPKRRTVTFLVDTGAQISALTRIEAERCGISVPSKSLIVLHALGKTQTVPMTLGDIMATGGGRPRGHHGSCGTFPNEPFRHGCFKG